MRRTIRSTLVRKSLPHEAKLSVLKNNKLCRNCISSRHFWRQCTSIHKCKVCQKPYHTLLHLDQPNISSTPTTVTTLAQSATTQDGAPVNTASQNVSRNSSSSNVPGILSATAIGVKYNSLLMTCRVHVKSPKGTHVVARALLDSASLASFVSKRLAQTLGLPRTKRDVISGIAGITHQSQSHSFTNFEVAPVGLSTKVLSMTAAIVPQVTCELPPNPIPFKTEWIT